MLFLHNCSLLHASESESTATIGRECLLMVLTANELNICRLYEVHYETPPDPGMVILVYDC